MATLGNKIVMFGGLGAPGSTPTREIGDTWEWDGTRWTNLMLDPASAPPASAGHAMATLGDKVILHGGVPPEGGFANSDAGVWVWQWDGATWTQLGPFCANTCGSAAPKHRAHAAMVAVNGTVLLFGGFLLGVVPMGPVATSNVPVEDTWEWDGATWWQRLSSPGGGGAAALGDKAVVFGGYTPGGHETWEWDQATWVRLETSADSDCVGCKMSALGTKIVRFGGDWDASREHRPALTWEWDGTSWTQHASATSPPGRDGHAMATLGDKVVLFGGLIGEGPLQLAGDTWEWDGADWTQRTSPLNPPARRGHAMVGAGEKVVLFGGQGENGLLDDTWVWDSVSWTRLAPASSPPARESFGMATVDGTVVLFGGVGNISLGTLLDDTWALSGTTWTRLPQLTIPSARVDPVMVSLEHQALLAGGFGLRDSWLLGKAQP